MHSVLLEHIPFHSFMHVFFFLLTNYRKRLCSCGLNILRIRLRLVFKNIFRALNFTNWGSMRCICYRRETYLWVLFANHRQFAKKLFTVRHCSILSTVFFSPIVKATKTKMQRLQILCNAQSEQLKGISSIKTAWQEGSAPKTGQSKALEPEPTA